MTTDFVLINVGNVRTGGPEAICQLSHELNQIEGVNAYMYFVTEKKPEIINEYRQHYDIREVASYPDDSILVIPEGQDPARYGQHRGPRWVWWLSAFRRYPLASYAGFGHLFQSAYVRQRMAAYGIEGLMLTDYIRDDFHSVAVSSSGKEDLVAFNGVKSGVSGLLLLTRCPELTFVPLAGMSDGEVKEWLARSKVYLDLGFHPGRDRMPREAALLECLVVTSREGAAGNSEDLPIPEQFKCDRDNLAALADFLGRLMTSYDSDCPRFDSYRAAIRGQAEVFRQEVRRFAAAAADSQWRSGRPLSPEMVALDALLVEDYQNYQYWRQAANQLALSALMSLREAGNSPPVPTPTPALQPQSYGFRWLVSRLLGRPSGGPGGS